MMTKWHFRAWLKSSENRLIEGIEETRAYVDDGEFPSAKTVRKVYQRAVSVLSPDVGDVVQVEFIRKEV